MLATALLIMAASSPIASIGAGIVIDVPATGVTAGSVRSLGELVASLASPEFETREAATRELATRVDIKQTDLEEALRSPGLTPEQRSRLILANRDKFAKSPRAALGVEFVQDFNSPDRAVISRMRPGFPAGDLQELLPGDELVAINGKEAVPEIARQVFRPIIISREPGEVLKTRVRRDGKIVDQDVHVGRYDDLYQGPNGQNFNRGGDIASAWRAHSEDYPMTSTNVIKSPEAFDAWAGAAEAARELDQTRSAAESIMGPSVAGGSQTRGVLPVTQGMLSSDDPEVRLAGFNGGVVWPGRVAADEQPILQIRPGNRLGLGGFGGFAATRDDVFQGALATMQLDRDRNKRMLMVQQNLAIDPTLSDALRKKAKVEAQKYQENIQAIDRQINDIRRAMGQRIQPAPRMIPR